MGNAEDDGVNKSSFRSLSLFPERKLSLFLNQRKLIMQSLALFTSFTNVHFRGLRKSGQEMEAKQTSTDEGVWGSRASKGMFGRGSNEKARGGINLRAFRGRFRFRITHCEKPSSPSETVMRCSSLGSACRRHRDHYHPFFFRPAN